MAHAADHQHIPPRSASENEARAHLMPSHGISINLPEGVHDHRPHPVKHMSAPAYQSPIRHHRRAPSRSKGVKETLNARSHYGSSDDGDGGAIHRINQYHIKTEIGRGSFGAVHLATDQYGSEFAVKEFSKSRLRKRAQSNLLRKPNYARKSAHHLAARMSFNSPLHRHSTSDLDDAANNSLSLIKEEIAIMKKLDHPNVVSLIEVLDDPDEDSLYMVLEMCKKGVVMKVGLDERAEPYHDEACRCWFRDMILGIEYLHAQGIIHRDLKPDNCLITHDDVLKIVDFGVSEMFEKESDMHTAKSAGSPAFMPPELCVARHGQVSGRAADIWSMGVTLYCLRYGHIPFEKTGMLELYECIRSDEVPLHEETNPEFADLMCRMLEKDPEKRITMEGLRVHPWVTKHGEDPLLPTEENCAEIVEPPTEIELNHAITGNMGGVMVVMKAVKKFKDLLMRKRPTMMESILGRESRIVAPPHSVHGPSKSIETHDRRPLEGALTTEGIHRDLDDEQTVESTASGIDRLTTQPSDMADSSSEAQRLDSAREASPRHLDENPEQHRQPFAHMSKSRTFPLEAHAKGHAHDPLTDTLFLSIGASADTPDDHDDADYPIVSESPGGVEDDIYEQAYQEEMRRIMEDRGDSVALLLNRRVDHLESLQSHPNVLIASSKEQFRRSGETASALTSKVRERATGGFAALVKQAQAGKQGTRDTEDHVTTNEEGPDGVDRALPRGVVDDEDHVPTNEEAPGGVDGPPARAGLSGRASEGLSRSHIRAETPTLPGSFPT